MITASSVSQNKQQLVRLHLHFLILTFIFLDKLLLLVALEIRIHRGWYACLCVVLILAAQHDIAKLLAFGRLLFIDLFFHRREIQLAILSLKNNKRAQYVIIRMTSFKISESQQRQVLRAKCKADRESGCSRKPVLRPANLLECYRNGSYTYEIHILRK